VADRRAPTARGERWGTAVPFAVAVLCLLAGACSSAKSAGPAVGPSTSPPRTTPPARVAENWTSHGHDLANTRATTSETVISAANVGQLQQAWTTENIKGMSSTPIIADGVLYFGDWTGSIRAVDATSGKERWATDLKTYYIGGSVAVEGDHVYVGTFDAKLTSLDRATGAVQWSTPVDDGPGSAVFGSPTIVDGLVIVGVASFEEFTNPLTPKFRGHVVGLDVTTGAEVWRYWTTNSDTESGPGIAIWSALSYDAERHLAYVPTGNNYAPPAGPTSDAVVAIDTRTGKQQWVTRFTTEDIWTLGGEGEGPDADVGAPPNLFDVNGRPALGVGDKGGTFHALDRVTGEELWKVSLTEGGAQGGVMASAAYADGRVYVASNKGGKTADLVALAVNDGKEAWRIDVGGHATGPVTLSNGVLYLGDDSGRFNAFDAADGKRLWEVTVPAPAASGAIVSGGTVFIGFGWWLAAAPTEPQGGLIAYRLPSDGGTGGTGGPGRDVPLGESVYIRNCSSCHGGDGGGGFGPSLKGVETKYTLESHLDIVTNGKDKMPPWKDTLTPEEIAAVVEYERATFK
jgi:outer membrane protein assembly factor BamB